MLAVQPYNPGRYPPGPRWAQFGDDLLGHSISAAEEAREKLLQKRQGMQQFHIERLQRAGFMPAHPLPSQTPASHPDPAAQAVEAFDHPSERPRFLPVNDEYHDPEGSEATISVPGSPRDSMDVLDPLARVARAGFKVAEHVGHQAKEAFKHNVADTVEIAKSGAKVLRHVAAGVGSASMRAASAGASHAHESVVSAMEPGSNTRRVVGSAASHAAAAAQTAAGHVKHVMDTVGPPISYGAYAAAVATGHGAHLAAQGLGHAAIATGHGAHLAASTLGNVAAAAADVATNHVAPAMHSAAKHGIMAATHALERATLSASEIVQALGELKAEGYSMHNALENGARPALAYGPARPSRTSTPPRHRNAKAAAVPCKRSFNTEQEWLEYSHNRGVLVEELYQRPNWREFVKVAGEKNDLRKKLLRMSPTDLAEILVKLDHL